MHQVCMLMSHIGKMLQDVEPLAYDFDQTNMILSLTKTAACGHHQAQCKNCIGRELATVLVHPQALQQRQLICLCENAHASAEIMCR